jgi:hypothetical protein
MGALFSLGMVVATPGALDLLDSVGVYPGELLARHQSGDWGDCGSEDWEANDSDLRIGGRLFSVYRISDGLRVWAITEADRSATMLLLPEEY